MTEEKQKDRNVRISPRTGKPVNENMAPHKTRKARKPSQSGDGEEEKKSYGDYVSMALDLYDLPDIDLSDEKQVEQRVRDYLNYCINNNYKPTVSGLAYVLNKMSRQTLWAIVNNQPTGGAGYTASVTPDVADSIKNAYKLQEVLWESYLSEGKINPVSGIFLGKNNFGYKDQTEHIYRKENLISDMSNEQLARRYGDVIDVEAEEHGSQKEIEQKKK